MKRALLAVAVASLIILSVIKMPVLDTQNTNKVLKNSSLEKTQAPSTDGVFTYVNKVTDKEFVDPEVAAWNVLIDFDTLLNPKTTKAVFNLFGDEKVEAKRDISKEYTCDYSYCSWVGKGG